MAEELLEDRVKKLEKALESLADVPKQLAGVGDRVERLEGRVTNVELQISQLRSDMHVGFSAASRELGDTREAILEVIDSGSKATQKLYVEGQRRLEDVKKEIVMTLRTEMRVLHEDFVERIKVLRRA